MNEDYKPTWNWGGYHLVENSTMLPGKAFFNLKIDWTVVFIKHLNGASSIATVEEILHQLISRLSY